MPIKAGMAIIWLDVQIDPLSFSNLLLRNEVRNRIDPSDKTMIKIDEKGIICDDQILIVWYHNGYYCDT